MADTEAWKRGERIGEFLVRIGALRPWQVDAILWAQAVGDGRLFGEIAIARGYVDDAALYRYVDAQALVAVGRKAS